MKPQTLEHVLSFYKIALANGRYTWRHNSVLDELVRIIQNLMMPESNKSTQKFVTEGGKIYVGSKKSTYHQAVPSQNLLGLEDNWKVSADARCSKSSLKHSIRFCGIFFPSLKQNFIAYQSSSRPDCIFEIHRL